MTEKEWGEIKAGDILIPLHAEISSNNPRLKVVSINEAFNLPINLPICIVIDHKIVLNNKTFGVGDIWGHISSRSLYNIYKPIEIINRLDLVSDD